LRKRSSSKKMNKKQDPIINMVEKNRNLQFWYDHSRDQVAQKDIYIDALEKTIDKAMQHLRDGAYDSAIAELRERDVVRRDVKEIIKKFTCIGSSTYLGAYEDPDTKNLYLVPYIDGVYEARDLLDKGNHSETAILNLLVSDDGTHALTGNGFNVISYGDEGAFTLGYDMDYSGCPEDGHDDEGVRYGMLWEFSEYMIWAPIKKMLEDGYLMLHYYWDDDLSVPEEIISMEDLEKLKKEKETWEKRAMDLGYKEKP
jgi:hypothetical protein